MKCIGSKYLNLRTEPLVKPSTLIVGLPFGHPVNIKQPSTRSGWFEVDTMCPSAEFLGPKAA